MDDQTKRDLHRFLAGGKLGRPETDAIRESVLDTIEREEKRPARVIRYAGWAGAALAAAAAVLIAVNVPRDPDPGHMRRGAAALAVTCSSGKLTACPASSQLVFSLSGKRGHGFLSAYAEPIGHDAERVFFFSKEDQNAELAVPAEGTRAAERTVPIEKSLRPGRYRVRAFLANRPLGREEMQGGGPGAGVHAKARVEVVIVE
jgi:hypothetical protein